MDQESRVLVVKNLIETGNIKQFKEIFLYIHKKYVRDKLGVNYSRFLNLIKNPKKFRYEETQFIANIFHVTHRSISELIHNQMDASKPERPKKKATK
jgi:hypothetical protein